jgi:isopentenyl-diphosphate Delta-isomerase
MNSNMTDRILIPAWVDGTLEPVEKMGVHRRGLRHKAVSIFVMNQGRILIQQRALHKYHTPGQWANTCCTHPHWKEAPLACAERRLSEELGIKGLALQPRGQIEYRAQVGPNMIEHEVVDVFFADSPDDLSVHPNPDEVNAIRWISLSELTLEMAQYPDKFTPWLHIYISDHAETILGSK